MSSQIKPNLTIPKISSETLAREMDSTELNRILKEKGVRGKIATKPWPEYADKNTSAEFLAGWAADRLILRFFVREQEVLGTHTEDGENVFEDSCVEFFARPDGANHYYNFEFNCLGYCLACVGPNRHDRDPLGKPVLDSINRHPSLGRQPVHFYDNSPKEWDLTVSIPAKAFILESFDSFHGVSMTGNFYKCGDKLRTPHYQTWSPIQIPKPDYHRPEWFGRIRFPD